MAERKTTSSSSSRSKRSNGRSGSAQTTGSGATETSSDEPDVFVDVPNVHVGKLEIDVERLEAHLALRAQAANLVNLVAGVHVGVDKVKIDLEDVDATATVKVRLENVYRILERTLTTIDENPEILQGVIETAGSAVDQVGDIGSQATKPGGALSQLTSGVGDTLGSLGDTLGHTLSGATDKLPGKQLLSGARRGGSQATGDGNGLLAKSAAAAVVGGALSWLGGALYQAQRRPRVLGVPVGRAHGLERAAKQIGRG
jgi:hypothetical protein